MISKYVCFKNIKLRLILRLLHIFLRFVIKDLFSAFKTFETYTSWALAAFILSLKAFVSLLMTNLFFCLEASGGAKGGSGRAYACWILLGPAWDLAKSSSEFTLSALCISTSLKNV